MINSSLAVRRFQKELQQFYHDDEYQKQGIYIHVPCENMFTFYSMIIGSDGTPYEYGFHFFKINIPDSYPLDPPKITYLTGDGKTRFNPNLYVEGKVCLSIINTWNGPKWSPIMSFGQVLLSIKSMILVEDPLRNEPGYGKMNKDKIRLYNDFIIHQNLKVALIKQFFNPPQHCDVFLPHMKTFILANKERILHRILCLMDSKNAEHIVLCYSQINMTTNYGAIHQDFLRLLALLEYHK